MGHIVNEITTCDIVHDPEMDYKLMPRVFNTALKTVLDVLRGYGIRERVDASLKQFTGYQKCWLAMYMRESQFKGNLKFLVNTQTPGIIDAAVLPQSITVEDVFEDSIFHEWGHVLEEWTRLGEGGEEAYDLIYGPFTDEEDFAEYMVDYFRYHKDKSSKRGIVDKVIKIYVDNVFK